MQALISVLVILLLPVTVTAASLTNQLNDHASPYLAMHGQDPVQWQEWNADTLARARQDNKLLFVSSGYFSCHWCHVMQKESFSDPNIARLLNEHFIPVKVDRELNAALDAKLIDFVERTQGIAGWPLNVFITPQGYPLVGMVYVPPDNFFQILNKLKGEWRNNGKELQQLAIDASQQLQPAEAGQDTNIPANLVTHYQQSLLQQTYTLADELQGGFGQENKFPSVPQLSTLLQVYRHSGEERLYRFLRLTLDQMASQGLRDQLAGGFFRYAVDPGWQIPHFEKMLYDNALLAELYLQAATVLKQPAYKQIAKQTIDFMQQHMRLKSGGLLASFSAIDNLGIEGGYYLWNSDEVKSLLTSKQWQIAETFWGLQGPPDLEHGHHLVQAGSVAQLARERGWPSDMISAELQAAKSKLLKQRQKRQLPADKKVLAAWNGLALSAYVAAGRQGFLKVETVRELKDYVVNTFWDGGQLYRLRTSAKFRAAADLEDYAYVIRGLLDWSLWQDKEQDWQQLRQLIDTAWQRFYSPQGWKLSEISLLKYREAQTLVIDGPMPSPAAVLIKSSLVAANRHKDQKLKNQALMALSVGHDTLMENTFWYASYVDALYTHRQYSKSE